MTDRSSHPLRSPNKAPYRVVSLRLRVREDPVQLPARTRIAPSTVGRILTSARVTRLPHIDRATGEPVRRYELPQPGPLIHVNVKKLGNIPDSSSWRFVGCRQGNWDRQTTPGKPCNKCGNELMKHAFVHTVINDYSRIAYAEVHDDETALIPGAVLIRDVDWFAARGIAIEPVVSDNGSTCRSHLWTDVCGQLGITVTKTRPRRPQTNGKIE